MCLLLSIVSTVLGEPISTAASNSAQASGVLEPTPAIIPIDTVKSTSITVEAVKPVEVASAPAVEQPVIMPISIDSTAKTAQNFDIKSPTPLKSTADIKPAAKPSPKIISAKPAAKVSSKRRALYKHKVATVQQPAPKAAPQPQQKEPGLISKVVTETKAIIGRAFSWLGTRYVWGGTSKKGVDCSGLTKQLYSNEGVALPHSAKGQSKIGLKVTRSSLVPGDLIFFNTQRGPNTHVGVYIGDNKFLHAANPRRGVRVDSLGSAYYNKRFATARRYKNA